MNKRQERTFKKPGVLAAVFVFSAFGADPEILSWSVATDSFTVLSKSVSYDSVRNDSGRVIRVDSTTGITWNGHIEFSCRDADNDSMGVFIDVEIGYDTIQADSVWGAPIVVTTQPRVIGT